MIHIYFSEHAHTHTHTYICSVFADGQSRESLNDRTLLKSEDISSQKLCQPGLYLPARMERAFPGESANSLESFKKGLKIPVLGFPPPTPKKTKLDNFAAHYTFSKSTHSIVLQISFLCYDFKYITLSTKHHSADL